MKLLFILYRLPAIIGPGSGGAKQLNQFDGRGDCGKTLKNDCGLETRFRPMGAIGRAYCGGAAPGELCDAREERLRGGAPCNVLAARMAETHLIKVRFSTTWSYLSEPSIA